MEKLDIGTKIKQLRQQNKLTQAQLASRLKTSQDNVSIWERNKGCPSLIALTGLAKVFNVSCDYLLGVNSNNQYNVYQQF